MLIGYARVSTDDQNLHLQKDALNTTKCDRIFEDCLSGSKSKRPGLDAALEMLRTGDTLVVWRLDRLGRSPTNRNSQRARSGAKKSSGGNRYHNQ